MNSRAVEHLQEAKQYFADAAKEGQQVGYAVLGVLLAASAGSEVAGHILPKGPLKETIVNGVENGGNILAGTIGVAGLAAVTTWGGKAAYHRTKAWFIERKEARSASTQKYVPVWSAYPAGATQLADAQ
jgi:hypothetical protein